MLRQRRLGDANEMNGETMMKLLKLSAKKWAINPEEVIN